MDIKGKSFNKFFILFAVFLFITFLNNNVYAKQIYVNGHKLPAHLHSEASYQKSWQNIYGGQLEYVNNDGTRVDCLTDKNAIEFDFANKWAESVGQALYYQYKTGKRGKVVLILEHPKSQMVYYNRVKKLAKIYDFDVEYITPDILCLDSKGRCSNKNCKCHSLK